MLVRGTGGCRIIAHVCFVRVVNLNLHADDTVVSHGVLLCERSRNALNQKGIRMV